MKAKSFIKQSKDPSGYIKEKINDKIGIGIFKFKKH